MGDWVHRTTKSYLQSIPENELPEPAANYIFMPNMSAVVGIPSIYWIITGDVITEMNQAEKDIVDAQILSDNRDSTTAQLDDLEEILRQIVTLSMREINILRGWTLDFKAEVAAAGNLGQLKTSVALLPDLNDLTFAQFKTQIRNDLGT